MISQIYEALQAKQSVIFVGPRGCGKSTVIDGVLSRGFSGVNVTSHPASSFNKGSSDPLPYAIILADRVLSYDMFETFMSSRDCSFIMEVDTPKGIPMEYYTDDRVRIIGWGLTHDDLAHDL